ncbi:MAG: hypothetical protein GQ564_10655 [Bacteroidales bacterium]|nr:hypothetical protein [Bacteroidales bacterium]
MGIQVRQRKYFQENVTTIFNDLTLNLGLLFIFGKRLIFDYNVGVGYRFINEKTNGKNKRHGGI